MLVLKTTWRIAWQKNLHLHKWHLVLLLHSRPLLFLVLQQDQEVFFLVNNPALLLELPHLYLALGPSLVLQWKTHLHLLLQLLTHLHLLYNSLTVVASTSVEVPLHWDHQAKTLAQGPIASLSKPKGQAPQRGGSVTLTLLGV
jgi:hypothetical protein